MRTQLHVWRRWSLKLFFVVSEFFVSGFASPLETKRINQIVKSLNQLFGGTAFRELAAPSNFAQTWGPFNEQKFHAIYIPW
jgi:hypothetical protein